MTTPFVLKCNYPVGVVVLEGLTKESTIAELRNLISSTINIQRQLIRIYCGYPRRQIQEGSDDKLLKDFDLKSGDNIMLDIVAASAVPDVEIVAASAVPDVEIVAVTSSSISPDGKSSGDTSSKESPDDKSITDTWSEGSVDSSRGRQEEFMSGIMMRQVVPANNSCLFSSIYFLMYEGDHNFAKANDLRRITAKAVAQNSSRYTSAVLGMSPYQYTRWIVNPAHWGGAIELSILSEYFKIEICAIDVSTAKMHRFGENAYYGRRIFLVYDGIHYDPLVMELSNSIQYIFSTSDNSAVELSMELAKEARSSRQYTDVSNFTLKCSVCDLNLRGDREARAHALELGHTEFGEV